MRKRIHRTRAGAQLPPLYFINKPWCANPDLRSVRPPAVTEKQEPELDLGELMDKLQRSPELASALSALISAQTSA